MNLEDKKEFIIVPPIVDISITSTDYKYNQTNNNVVRVYTADGMYNRQRIYVTGNTIPDLLTLIKKSLDRLFPDSTFYPTLKLKIRETNEQIIDNLEDY